MIAQHRLSGGRMSMQRSGLGAFVTRWGWSGSRNRARLMYFIGAAAVYVVCAAVGGLFIYGCDAYVPATPIRSFSISPGAIPLGNSATLSWTWTDSTTPCN